MLVLVGIVGYAALSNVFFCEAKYSLVLALTRSFSSVSILPSSSSSKQLDLLDHLLMGKKDENETHLPGIDEIVRVVDIRTQNETIRGGLNKTCILVVDKYFIRNILICKFTR